MLGNFLSCTRPLGERSRLRASRHLAASLLLAIGALAAACTTQVITRSDEIVTRCAKLYDPTCHAQCVEEQERVLEASSAGCLDEYDAYFACRDAAPPEVCLAIPDDGCKFSYYGALVKCTRASPTYEPCRQADERLDTCTGKPGWSVAFDFCDGTVLCHARCVAALSCEELVSSLQGEPVPKYDTCDAACQGP